MQQISLFEILDDLNKPDKPKPLLQIGVRIYSVVLDVIETGIVDHLWEVGEIPDRPFHYGYSALRDREDGFRSFITFWDKDINQTVFTSKGSAEQLAESRRERFKVIRESEMKPLETIGYVQTTRHGPNGFHYLVILDGNMIYKKVDMYYPFLYKFNSQTEMRCELGKMKREIENGANGAVERCDTVKVELKDMYLTKTGNWSSYGYAEYNKPVLRATA